MFLFSSECPALSKLGFHGSWLDTEDASSSEGTGMNGSAT